MKRIVASRGAGGRLDRFLADELGLSRRRVQALIDDARVRVDSRPAIKGQSIISGAVVEIDDGDLSAARPPAVELPVLCDSPGLVAVDKPATMPVHPLRAGDPPTVADFLHERFPETRTCGASREAGLVHRLDTPTSGVLVAARSPSGYDRLREQFRRGTVQKVYVAVVEGALAGSDEIDLPIAHSGRGASRMRVRIGVDDTRGRGVQPAETRYCAIQPCGSGTFVEVRIRTGVRHQIRAHLAHLGHPVMGDTLYGAQAIPEAGILLHASRLEVSDPVTGERLRIESPLPPRFPALPGAGSTVPTA